MSIAHAFQQHLKSIFTLSLLILLTACGGGGSKKDITPDAFSFTSVTDAAISTEVTSTAITVAGINKATAISITGGTYSINNGAFTAAAGTVTSGQTVKVKVTSSAATSTAVVATVTIGGVNGTFTVTTLADTTAPTAQIMFPPAVSMSDGTTVKIRGTAHDDYSSVSSVTVNGVGAVSTDNFATWTADVPLSLGENTLTVATSDSLNNSNSDAAHVSIKRVSDIASSNIPDANTVFSTPSGIMLDRNRNRVLVVDQSLKSIIAVSLTTGARTLFSSANIPDVINKFIYPYSIVLDSVNDRALVTDYGPDMGVLALNLTNGARTIVSNSTIPNSNDIFSRVSGLTFDSEHNQAIVLDDLLHAIFKVDLNSGLRTIFSSNLIPNTQSPLSRPDFLALDFINNRVLVSDWDTNGILAVNLSSGERTLFSGVGVPDTNNAFLSPRGITLDGANNRALVVDTFLNAIVAVNLSTGTRTILSGSFTTDESRSTNQPNGNNSFQNIFDIQLDVTKDVLYVADITLPALFTVDAITGERVIFSK